MIDRIPSGVPKVGILPAGVMVFRIGTFERENTTNDGRWMPRVDLTVEEPADAEGLVHFEGFCIGMQDDPEGDEPSTWKKSFGARNLITMADAAGVETQVPPMELLDSLEGQLVGAVVGISTEPETDKKTGEPNQYAGQQRNRLNNWFTPGKREPYVKEDEDKPSAKAASAKAKAGVPAKAPAKAPAKPAPKAAPKPAPAKRAPVEEPEEVEEVEEVEEPEVEETEEETTEETEEAEETEEVEEEPEPAPAPKKAAPKAPAKPAPAAAKPAAKAAPAKAPGNSADPLLKCVMCPEGSPGVRRSQFGKHMETEHPEE